MFKNQNNKSKKEKRKEFCGDIWAEKRIDREYSIGFKVGIKGVERIEEIERTREIGRTKASFYLKLFVSISRSVSY